MKEKNKFALAIFFIIAATAFFFHLLQEPDSDRPIARKRAEVRGSVGAPELAGTIESKVVPRVHEVGAAESPNRLYKKNSIGEIKIALDESLREEGFAIHEIGFISDQLEEILYANHPSPIDELLARSSAELVLDETRSESLRRSLLFALTEIGGTFTIEEFESCLSRRLDRLHANACLRRMVEEFKRSVFNDPNLIGDRISNQFKNQINGSSNETIKEAMLLCESDFNTTSKIFALELSECPK